MEKIPTNFEGEVNERKLDMENFSRIAEAAQKVVAEKGQDFFAWKNAPEITEDGKITHSEGWGDQAVTREVSNKEALDIMNQKLNGAYGERFITSLGTVAALIANGYNVRFVQFRSEPGVPFNASGWTVMVVEGMPIFHISPEDLKLADVEDLVEILDDNADPSVSWKNTNKVGEFEALLQGACQPGLDLVQIAQEGSKQK